MDFSWLGDLFGGIIQIFKPLTAIAHWKIWAAIWDLIQRFRSWYKWYQQNVQKRMQAIRALYQHYFNTYVAPVLKIIDLIRRITGAVGIINKKLAAKLNVMFLRVEGFIVAPFAKAIARINQIQNVFSGFLTPLGYLDRFTLLNSVWRDIGSLAELLRNPLGGTTPTSPPPSPKDFHASLVDVTNFFEDQDSPITDGATAGIAAVKSFLGVS